MSKSRIYLSPPHMGGEELKYIQEAFDSNWIAPLGANVDGFEEELQAYTGKKHCVALSSGTAAIHLGLICLGVQPGDEVICQSFTFSASANPIVYLRATPVFVDSEEKTWNMCPGLLDEAINDRIKKGRKPKAIIVVHLYGMPAQMHRIMEVANKYEIPVLEDAAEALGSRIRVENISAGRKDGSHLQGGVHLREGGENYVDKVAPTTWRHTGTFGKAGVLSFNGNKIITTSGGGALISDDEELIKHARFLATQARDPAPHYEHSHIGYNYRMSNILAGIGRGQMKVLDDRVRRRREIFEFYKKELGHIEGITFPLEPDGYFSNRWLTTIVIDPDITGGITREDIRLNLEEKNIESRPLWKPMHMQPVLSRFKYYGNGTSDMLFEKGLCLPSGSGLTGDDLTMIISMVQTYLFGKTTSIT